MTEDRHLSETEKLDAEFSRSVSVAKVKEAHKQKTLILALFLKIDGPVGI